MTYYLANLTQERLQEVLRYEPETGHFYWKVRPSNRTDMGKRAGYVGTWGYHIISVDAVKYRANRLAWLYMTGEWPKDQVDHINCDRGDDRWENLRAATLRQNRFNCLPRKDSRTGVVGVSENKAFSTFTAYIKIKGRKKNLGTYASIEEAAQARKNFAQAIHGEFFRPS